MEVNFGGGGGSTGAGLFYNSSGVRDSSDFRLYGLKEVIWPM